MIPTEEGFYWATTKRKNGNVGGLRWIVRLFRFTHINPEILHVQFFGDKQLFSIDDCKDYEGPIGNIQWVNTKVKHDD